MKTVIELHDKYLQVSWQASPALLPLLHIVIYPSCDSNASCP